MLDTEFEKVDFIKNSKEIADHLNDIQGGSNSPGFILILHGIITNDNIKIIGILKLEKQEGAQLEEAEKNGKKTFKITNVKDLILSKNTKLFKIGVFFKDSPDSYIGNICDNQLNSKGEVARFFLEGFLGCKLAIDYAIQTRNFYNFSIDYFKKYIDDPLIQNQYRLHLQSYILRQSNNLNVKTFASTYLRNKDKNKYEKHILEKGVPVQLLKDTKYIEPRINKHLYQFENGIQIIGTNEDFGEKVRLEPIEDGNTRATVESRLKNI